MPQYSKMILTPQLDAIFVPNSNFTNHTIYINFVINLASIQKNKAKIQIKYMANAMNFFFCSERENKTLNKKKQSNISDTK